MSSQLTYTVFETEAGWMAILASERGLLRTSLPRPTVEEVLLELGDDASRATRDDAGLGDLAERFRRYFRGVAPPFPEQLDPSCGTAFQREVWETAQRIPYGETRSYGWIAEEIGRPRAARAVGQAIGSNPLGIIIPCHRVIAGDGTLGGFGGGLPLKQRLLDMERAGRNRQN
jgi:methylated-DNA-[protein]-cysteine S-methyltransferase